MQWAEKISVTAVLLGDLMRTLNSAGKLALAIADHDDSLSEEMARTLGHLERSLTEIEAGMLLLSDRLDLNGQEQTA